MSCLPKSLSAKANIDSGYGQKWEAEASRQHSYLQDPFVIYFVEDCPIDLVGFEGDPVEHWHAELGLDRLLDFHS